MNASQRQAAPKQSPERPTSPQECGARPAVYWAGEGPKVHVIRRGTVTQSKPLDPGNEVTELVLIEVRINSKIATAYGPSFEELRRAGPSKQVEEEVGSAIRWQDSLIGLPTTLMVLAEDGPDIIARLRFEQCGHRAERARERSRPIARQPPSEAAAPKRDGAPTALPQGAIQ